MTRRSQREVERAIGSLEESEPDDDRVYVVSIGGDPDSPSGWMSHEEHEQHFGERPDSGFNLHMSGGRQ